MSAPAVWHMATNRENAAGEQLTVEHDGEVLHALQPLIARADFAAAATEFLSALVQACDCDRAALGFVHKGAVRICAVSDHALPASSVVLPEVAAAMDESLLQDAVLAWPALPSDFPYILLAHAEMARRNGLSSALTIPLSHEGRLIGAIAFESRRRGAPLAEHQSFLKQACSRAAPLLHLKWQLQRPLPARALDAVRTRLPAPLRRLSRRAAVLAAASALAVLAALAAWPVSYEITADARVDALVQRVITSPIDGYLKEVRVRPGDKVSAGQTIAELNDELLRAEYRKLEAESLQQANALAEAMARADRTQLALRRAKLDEVNAQKDFVGQQLEHTRLIAPFDGIVIKGDLTQMLGSPLKRGDMMLVLSQGSGYRVVLEVPEQAIGDIAPGQSGRLVLSAMPGTRFPIRVARVSPVATVAANGNNVFEVEAELTADAPQLVPGLQGVARVEAGDRPLALQWTEGGWQRLRFLLWRYLG